MTPYDRFREQTSNRYASFVVWRCFSEVIKHVAWKVNLSLFVDADDFKWWKQRFPVKMWRSHVGVTETPVVTMLWLSEPSWAFSEANNSLTERFTGGFFLWLIIFVSYSHDPCRQTHSICEAMWPSFDFRIETLQGVSFAHGAKSWIIREFWL